MKSRVHDASVMLSTFILRSVPICWHTCKHPLNKVSAPSMQSNTISIHHCHCVISKSSRTEMRHACCLVTPHPHHIKWTGNHISNTFTTEDMLIRFNLHKYHVLLLHTSLTKLVHFKCIDMFIVGFDRSSAWAIMKSEVFHFSEILFSVLFDFRLKMNFGCIWLAFNILYYKA